ncbi:MAG: NADP-dependent phosphogluconate dehydrogenase [Rubricoccaceae bacterium]
MGRNLALNALDAGAAVAGFDLSEDQTAAFSDEAGNRQLVATTSQEAFLEALLSPRALLVMVPAGKAVDAVIGSFAPHLQPGDLLIDGGNSFFRDTERRQLELAESGIHFFGMGVSGGEEGARHGPSMMPGGPVEAYDLVNEVLEGMAASVDGEPCVAHLGAGASGHYVKMVHNGIEYAMMQLLAESYDLLHRGFGMGGDEMAALFDSWNQGALQSFLVEITADILRRRDDLVEGSLAEPAYLLDAIADRAAQKGTGKWTSQNALDLGIPTPSIDAAVSARYLSALKGERVAASEIFGSPDRSIAGIELAVFQRQLHEALHLAFVSCYAQGFALLREASNEYGYGLDMRTIATIWRGGCIIRAAMLETFREAFANDADLPNLLVAPAIRGHVRDGADALATVVSSAAIAGIPTPAFASSMAYVESYRTARLPANLIMAQRDAFGAHTFERLDRDGTFHVDWTLGE